MSGSLFIRVNFVVVIYKMDNRYYEQVLSRADAVLYKAKGRNIKER
jgi:hypothetical protein